MFDDNNSIGFALEVFFFYNMKQQQKSESGDHVECRALPFAKMNHRFG